VTTAIQQPHIGDISVEFLGVEWPDNFQGYGLGSRSKFNCCAYAIGDTEAEALDDCLEMATQQGFDIDDETEQRIKNAYGAADDRETALEYLGIGEIDPDALGMPPLFHVGIKWRLTQP
jgi:hypothetical protein